MPKRLLNKLFALFMAVTMTVSIVPANTIAAPSKYVTSIKVSKSSVTVKKGKKATVKATVKVKNKASTKVTVKSSNSKVATAKVGNPKKGVSTITITGKKKGSATITVKTKTKNKKGKYLSKKIKVKVTGTTTILEDDKDDDKDYVKSLKLVDGDDKEISKTTLVLQGVGKKTELLFYAEVSKTSKSLSNHISAKSSNTSVVEVVEVENLRPLSKKYLNPSSVTIKAKAKGTATITVTTNEKDKNGKKVSKTIKVTVNKYKGGEDAQGRPLDVEDMGTYFREIKDNPNVSNEEKYTAFAKYCKEIGDLRGSDANGQPIREKEIIPYSQLTSSMKSSLDIVGWGNAYIKKIYHTGDYLVMQNSFAPATLPLVYDTEYDFVDDGRRIKANRTFPVQGLIFDHKTGLPMDRWGAAQLCRGCGYTAPNVYGHQWSDNDHQDEGYWGFKHNGGSSPHHMTLEAWRVWYDTGEVYQSFVDMPYDNSPNSPIVCTTQYSYTYGGKPFASKTSIKYNGKYYNIYNAHIADKAGTEFYSHLSCVYLTNKVSEVPTVSYLKGNDYELQATDRRFW